MAIKCCKECVATKRHPGCHDHCPEYAEEKAENARLKEIADKQRDINIGLRDQRTRGVYKARKNRRTGGKYEQ